MANAKPMPFTVKAGVMREVQTRDTFPTYFLEKRPSTRCRFQHHGWWRRRPREEVIGAVAAPGR